MEVTGLAGDAPATGEVLQEPIPVEQVHPRQSRLFLRKLDRGGAAVEVM
jgi:hypothetical protein